MEWKINLMATAIVLIMVAMVVVAQDDKAKLKEECTEQLVGMVTCLSYVQGQENSPTPDCCSSLRQVLNSDKKCLCAIIQYRNDPDLGLGINLSLAFTLPSVCHANADLTTCPALLHLDPNSPAAQEFYQLAKGPASAPSGFLPEPSSMSPTAGSNDGNNSGRTTSVSGTNHAQILSKQWHGLEVAAYLFVFLYIFILV